MNHTKAGESETSSTNGDVIDIDLGENAAMMSDGEVKSELEELEEAQVNNLCKHQSSLTISGTKILGDTPLAIPKIPSAVVIPESSLSHHPNIRMRGSSAELKNKAEKPKQIRNKNTSAKKKTSKSDGSLVALLSKVSMSSTGKNSKTVEEPKIMNGLGTPANVKRIRSAGTTPEDGLNQPDKLAKMDTNSKQRAKEGGQSRNLLERRTLNLKVSLLQRPPTSKELQEIKQFLQYQIEQALDHRANFIPLFSAPVKIGKDGVYVFCNDQACAQWIAYIAKTGIPGISDALVVVPQDTPMNFNPLFVMVRVVSKIPTKLPKDKILNNLAQLNRDLNTESWQIKNIRPKGAGSMVYMRVDKRSFDTITERGNKVNWILGPIDIRKEEYNPRTRTQTTMPTQSLAANNSVDISNFEPSNHHVKPPSERNVDTTTITTPRSTGLTKRGGFEPIIEKEFSYTDKNDGSTTTPKIKVKVA